MKSDTIVITGVGMVSSLGWGAVAACAAARAGITRVAELEDFTLWDETAEVPVPATGHRAPGVEGFQGIGRLARLGTIALQDLRDRVDLSESALVRTGLFINLSSSYYLDQARARRVPSEEEKAADPREAREREAGLSNELPRLLHRFSGMTVPSENRRTLFGDQAGVFRLILEASELLQRGTLERCIIGAIDSNIDPGRLEILNELGLLKGPDNASGLIPGEAAAFILIERLDLARARRANVEAGLGTPAVVQEQVHRFGDRMSAGLALSEAVTSATTREAGGEGSLGVMIGGLNGDRWRAMEWGCASVRLQARGGPKAFEEWYPAVSFGETGAAAGAISIVMATRAIARGYSRGERIGIWTSSDNGIKAAGCVNRPS
jgi:3-oxoacyl-[acyl-carrier-protein] synthase-1